MADRTVGRSCRFHRTDAAPRPRGVDARAPETGLRAGRDPAPPARAGTGNRRRLPPAVPAIRPRGVADRAGGDPRELGRRRPALRLSRSSCRSARITVPSVIRTWLTIIGPSSRRRRSLLSRRVSRTPNGSAAGANAAPQAARSRSGGRPDRSRGRSGGPRLWPSSGPCRPNTRPGAASCPSPSPTPGPPSSSRASATSTLDQLDVELPRGFGCD